MCQREQNRIQGVVYLYKHNPGNLGGLQYQDHASFTDTLLNTYIQCVFVFIVEFYIYFDYLATGIQFFSFKANDYCAYMQFSHLTSTPHPNIKV